MSVTDGAAPARQGGWAAAGMSAGNASYRTQTLKFEPIELSFDESVPFKALLRLWLSAVVTSILTWTVFLVIWLFTGGVSNGNTGLLRTGSILSFIVFWIVLLFSRFPEPIAEWRTLLEDKAPAATSAYAAIYGSLKPRRMIPVDVSAVRVRSDVFAREVVNNRLMITDRGYMAYVSVFEYGTSLYVGWTMWRNRRGSQLIATFFKDMVGGILGRTGMINQMLRTEKPRAMREAVHSAVREGVEVAVRGIEVSMVSTFGHDIPVQDIAVAAPSPSAAPAPPQHGRTS